MKEITMSKPIDINKDCQFIKDLENNNKIALYNLAVIKVQLQLYNKGILPSRHFRLKHIKNYIGMSGTSETLYDKIVKLDEVIKGVNLTNKGGEE